MNSPSSDLLSKKLSSSKTMALAGFGRHMRTPKDGKKCWSRELGPSPLLSFMKAKSSVSNGCASLLKAIAALSAS